MDIEEHIPKKKHKKAILLLLVLAQLLGLTSISGFFVSAYNKINPFTSIEGNFSILFPETPSEDKIEQPDHTAYTFKVSQTFATFGLSYIDYPESIVRERGNSYILRAALMEGVNKSQGKVLNESSLSIGSFPGLEYEVATGGSIIKGRNVMVKNRLFIIVVHYEKDKYPIYPVSGNRFLKSFKILNPGNVQS